MNVLFPENLFQGEMRAVVVGLIGWVVVYAVRRCSASTRHAVCMAAILMVLAAPFSAAIHLRQVQPLTVSAEPVIHYISSKVLPSHPIPPPATINHEPDVATAPNEPSPIPLGIVLMGAYLAVSALLLGRLALGVSAAWQIVRRSKPFDSADCPSTVCPIRVTDQTSVPLAIRWPFATIVLPVEAAKWPAARLKASVLHEEAHHLRGDVFWLLIAGLTCALNWANPFAWLLASTARQTSEESTDNLVLAQGVQPADYAQVLLSTASEIAKSPPAFAATMARRSHVGSRVRAVLQPDRARGQMSLGITTISTCALATTLAASTCLGFAYLQKGTHVEDQDPNLTYPGTVAGAKSNGFVAKAEDGRHVKLLELQRWTPTGIQAWRPDGTPIAAADRLPEDFSRHNPAELHFFVQADTDVRDDSVGGGMGSSYVPSPGGPSMEIFTGGYTRAYDPKTPGKRIFVDFIEVPNLGPSRENSYTFGLSDHPAAPFVRIDLRTRKVVQLPVYKSLRHELGDKPAQVMIEWPGVVNAIHRDSNRNPIMNNGYFTYVKIHALTATCTLHAPSMVRTNVVAHAYRIHTDQIVYSAASDTDWKGTIDKIKFSWTVRPSELSHIDFLAGQSVHCGFLGVKLRPNGVDR